MKLGKKTCPDKQSMSMCRTWLSDLSCALLTYSNCS